MITGSPTPATVTEQVFNANLLYSSTSTNTPYKVVQLYSLVNCTCCVTSNHRLYSVLVLQYSTKCFYATYHTTVRYNSVHCNVLHSLGSGDSIVTVDICIANPYCLR
jgi:hypothetical protein